MDETRDKQGFPHHMLKEIHEQPETVAAAMRGRLLPAEGTARLAELDPLRTRLKKTEHLTLLSCGTSYYAGLTARYWLEDIAGIPCNVDIASEYRYRKIVANPKQLIVTISQSGETLDTMEALKYAKAQGQDKTLSICNVPESAIPRASKLVFYTRAGAEIGVASTKAFTTQLVALFALTGVLA